MCTNGMKPRKGAFKNKETFLTFVTPQYPSAFPPYIPSSEVRMRLFLFASQTLSDHTLLPFLSC